MIISRPLYRVFKPYGVDRSFVFSRGSQSFYLRMSGNIRESFNKITSKKTVIEGHGAPTTATDGETGDYYLDVDNHLLYGPYRGSWLTLKGVQECEEILIQGARPDPAHPWVVGGAINNQTTVQPFMGGYRCTLKIVTPPTYGQAAIAGDQLGFDYTPPSPTWVGRDSFSYSLTNIFGYESDAKCIYIRIGL